LNKTEVDDNEREIPRQEEEMFIFNKQNRLSEERYEYYFLRFSVDCLALSSM
jgi:hypothetical protein